MWLELWPLACIVTVLFTHYQGLVLSATGTSAPDCSCSFSLASAVWVELSGYGSPLGAGDPFSVGSQLQGLGGASLLSLGASSLEDSWVSPQHGDWVVRLGPREQGMACPQRPQTHHVVEGDSELINPPTSIFWELRLQAWAATLSPIRAFYYFHWILMVPWHASSSPNLPLSKSRPPWRTSPRNKGAGLGAFYPECSVLLKGWC